MRDVLYYPQNAHVNLEELPDDLAEFAEGLLCLGEMIAGTRALADSLSRGELDAPLPSADNELAAPLKSLQATLRHLTWQTKQVALGDYSQHINFMGEFSDAFNEMIDQLREQRDSLKTEMDTVSREMEDLKRSSSAEKEEYSRLEDVAYRDTQTGAYNRHYGMKILGEWLAGGWGFCLIFVDMDLLKYVNDVYGHREGDVYIKTVADLLGEASPMAVISRLGGDEFMVLLKRGDARDDDMNEVFERLRAKLVESSETDGKGNILYSRSMSFGVVEVSAGSGLTSSDILSLADERMYEYKKKHKKERRP